MSLSFPRQLNEGGVLREHRNRIRALEAAWLNRAGGIDFNQDNYQDHLGKIADYLVVRVTGSGPDGAGIYFGVDSDGTLPGQTGDIQLQVNSNGQIYLLNTGGDGGIRIKNDGGFADNDGVGVYVEDNGKGGIFILSTGSGSGWNNGSLRLLNNGGTFSLENNDQGIVVYSTGNFDDGRIDDLATAVGSFATSPGMIIAASNGILFSQGGILVDFETGSLNECFLYMDTGDTGKVLLHSHVVLDTTTDPGIPGALWNDGGTVRIST